MTDEQRRNLARSLNVAEDTPEDKLHEIAAERAETPPTDDPPESSPQPGDEPAPEPKPDDAPPPNPSERVDEPVAAKLPEGVVAIDADELARLRAGAETAGQLASQQDERERDGVVAAAMKEGRFPPARRQHYVDAWAKDREGTRILLTAKPEDGGLAPGLVPVAARGVEPSPEGVPSADEHEAYMRTHFPQAVAARERRGGEVRHRQEA